MHVEPDGSFDRARYRTVLAGTGQRQEPLFLCDITHAAGFVALQDQTERRICPAHFDDDGQLHPIIDDPGVLSRIVSCSVLSVYTNHYDWMTEAIYTVGGKDATEPFYWK